MVDLATQRTRVDEWCMEARLAIGRATCDCDGTPFLATPISHPAEQYPPPTLEQLAELEADGFGEVEVHAHHGVEKLDHGVRISGERWKSSVICSPKSTNAFRDSMDLAAVDMRLCMAIWRSPTQWAGAIRGVDSEMRILAETGCYADLTLARGAAAAPDAANQRAIPIKRPPARRPVRTWTGEEPARWRKR